MAVGRWLMTAADGNNGTVKKQQRLPTTLSQGTCAAFFVSVISDADD